MRWNNDQEPSRIVIAGPKQTGKTALVRQLLGKYTSITSKNENLYSHENIHEYKKTVYFKGYNYITPSNISFEICDTGSSKSAKENTSYAYIRCSAILIVCNLGLTNAANIKRLKAFVNRNKQELDRPDNVRFILVGINYESRGLPEEVAFSRIKSIAEGLKDEHYEPPNFEYAIVCPETGKGVKELFDDVLPSLISQSSPSSAQKWIAGNSSSVKLAVSSSITHIKEHSWRYAIGILLALIVIIIMIVPGIIPATNIATLVTGSTVGGVFFGLALSLAAFMLPIIVGYGLKSLGQGLKCCANKISCFNRLHKASRFVKRIGKICLGQSSWSDYFGDIDSNADVESANSVNRPWYSRLSSCLSCASATQVGEPTNHSNLMAPYSSPISTPTNSPRGREEQVDTPLLNNPSKAHLDNKIKNEAVISGSNLGLE